MMPVSLTGSTARAGVESHLLLGTFQICGPKPAHSKGVGKSSSQSSAEWFTQGRGLPRLTGQRIA